VRCTQRRNDKEHATIRTFSTSARVTLASMMSFPAMISSINGKPLSGVRSSCCTYTIFKCGGMPSILPLPMFVSNVVSPAPFFPMMP
jgi:hypothetical protein